MAQQSIRLVDIAPTIYLVRLGNGLKQLVRVTVGNDAEPQDAVLAVDSPSGSVELAMGTLDRGETTHDVSIDELSAPGDVTFTLKSSAGIADQRRVPWQPPRRWIVHVVQASHHDLGYTDLPSNVLRVHDEWLDNAIDMAEGTAAYPDDARFRIVIEQAWSLTHYLRHAPPQRASRMVDLLRSGRFEVNALYGNMTTENCSHEELLRCLYPAFKLKREYGIPIRSAEHNDITGISWGLCQALTGAGIRFFAPGLPLYYDWGNLGLESFWDAGAIFPWGGPSAFWWQAPSGKRLLFWSNNSGCGGDAHPSMPGLAPALQRLGEHGYPLDVLRWPVNVGARDNSPYSAAFVETVRAWNQRWAYPRLMCSTNARFYTDLMARVAAPDDHRPGAIQLPVLRGELPGQDYPVGATSTATPTAANRNAHTAVNGAEKLAVLASLHSDYRYQREPLEEAYEETLIYDEHTWGHHFPAGPAALAGRNEKSMHAYRGAALAHDVMSKAMARIADHVAATGEGYPLVVFNLTGSTRTDIVRAPLREFDNCGSTMIAVPPEHDARGEGYLRGVLLQDRWHVNLPPDVIAGRFHLVDAADGRRVDYQIIPVDADSTLPYSAERAGIGAGTPRYGQFETPTGLRRELCFVAVDVPSYGYKTYRLVPSSKARGSTPALTRTASAIENESYRISFDRKRKVITGICNKAVGRELLDLLAPHAFGAVVVRDPDGHELVAQPRSIRVGLKGPLCMTIEINSAVYGHPAIRQTFTLYAGIRRIDVAAWILKDATPLLDVHIAFPFHASQPAFRYEGALAALTPIDDYLPGAQLDRVAVQNWVKVCSDGSSIVWSSLDAPVVSLGELWPGYVSPAHRCVVTDALKQHRRITRDDLQHGWIYSNLYSNNFGTNFTVSQPGETLFRYTFTTRAGDVSDGEAALIGGQAVTPLEQILARPHATGTLPPADALVRVSPEDMQLLALKQAEDGDGVIARLWNMGTHPAQATLKLGGTSIDCAYRTNVVEENLEQLSAGDEPDRVSVTVDAHDIATLRLRLKATQ